MIKYRKLILNNDNFPSSFNDIENLEQYSQDEKIEFIENNIIKQINLYNPKMSVMEILYENLTEQFEDIHISKYTGAIVEDQCINDKFVENYRKHKYFIYNKDGRLYARKIIEYIFVSPATERSRNAFCSQVFFPVIIDYIKTYISSPSYSIANHKFMFINIVNNEISANSILRPLAVLTKIGMDYVDVFTQAINLAQIPNDLNTFLKQYDRDYHEHYNEESNIYTNDYYLINFNKKIFQIKMDYILNNIELKTQEKYDFKGSSEKFFWIVILPISIWAYNLDYKINFKNYVDFCNEYRGKFKDNSDKFLRFEFLINYFNKYFI